MCTVHDIIVLALFGALGAVSWTAWHWRAEAASARAEIAALEARVDEIRRCYYRDLLQAKETATDLESVIGHIGRIGNAVNQLEETIENAKLWSHDG